jgi:hypothetical protein
MAQFERKNFGRPDETRPFEGHGKTDVVFVDERPVARAVFEPGWRWSRDIKPIAGTEMCEVAHFGYCVSGRMRVMMPDGSEQEIEPGDVYAIPPDHDAEVSGDESCVMVDFGEVAEFAKR